MKNEYRVSGRYLARYPDGHFSGELGISTSIRAESKKQAKLVAAEKTMTDYGYIQFEWCRVLVRKVPLEA